ncbi:type III-B CRISPR module-associated protein Cmr5 [Methylomarinum sp. Ch1-1]|uniref:CRISPR type III-B/RAMP module-associated protein Cmr5 n=1 Tax=Methylomarinum roseum TaxID=3067653 RepID=A0AAU7NZL8_9GAMM|nr:type III-B CRISPR module-associated protein Cmr5 [Methylomarinum sp. Ch1-1]MDP4521424.1 type III-B CRISPR module-associated protein Cmr5 [Methylomarinum sp. Ch1-1]
MTQTIQQQRAAFALQYIKALPEQLEPDQQKEFTRNACALPAMVHMNGLGQALAFCRVKGSNDRESYKQLYQLVSDWLCQPGQPYAGKADALEGITQMDMSHYQLAQAEALVLMSWVKKFAKAFLAEDAA